MWHRQNKKGRPALSGVATSDWVDHAFGRGDLWSGRPRFRAWRPLVG
ncbi:hypothetical protein [Dokdonia sinensis]|nr:hypothetical protein [Dokdonia sinensis]